MTRTKNISQDIIAQKVLRDLYEFVRLESQGKATNWNIKKCADKMRGFVTSIREVKTLWQVDKAIDLSAFYCDSFLWIQKKRVLIKSLKDLEGRKKVLINGIAGQGKSILLRYLCTESFYKDQLLPIFIEIRRVFPNETILNHIEKFFNSIGIPKLEEKYLSKLLNCGKVVLFLDGFDEVLESEKARLIREIEQIALLHEQLPIIVTSRPESGMEVSPLFEVIKLSNLTNGEYKNVVKKLTDDNKFADSLIKQVENHRSKLDELLSTPLLVTLLVLSYKSFQELPDQLSEFYDSIFQVLLQRHDGAKPGFKRPRRCPFNDNQYRSIFESFCYESKREVKSIFEYEEILEFGKSALQKNNLEADATKYIEDIIKVTCLILKEGKDYRFIHKSVQEYYAAAFIKHRPEPVAIKFYEKIVKRQLPGGWSQELFFLSEIDKYRYNKYYRLPLLCFALQCSVTNIPDKCPTVDINYVRKVIGEDEIWFRITQKDNFISLSSYRAHGIKRELGQRYFQEIVKFDFSLLYPIISKMQSLRVEEQIGDLIVPEKGISINEIIDLNLINDRLVRLTQNVVNYSYDIAKKISAEINRDESINIDL